ncbi:MAG: YihY/virulence factor BrkB family protein [Bauldia sp.]
MLRTALDVTKQAFADWSDDGAPRLAAALAYYTAFSIAPLLFLVVAVAGLVFADADTVVATQLAQFIGADAAAFLTRTAERSGPSGGVVATVIGVVVLVFGAAGVFGQLQDALDTIWEVRPKAGQGFFSFIRQRFFSFALVGGAAFLLLVSLIVSTAISAAINYLGDAVPGAGYLWQALAFVVGALVTGVVFAVIFKVVPDVVIRWRDVWFGAAVTGVLFAVGQILLGLYLGMQATNSAYGAAGSLIVLLLWVYYTSQILFFGAEITQVTARRRGSEIVPSPNAERVTADERLRQGLDRSRVRPVAPPAAGLDRTAETGIALALGYVVGRSLRRRGRS